MTKNVIHSIQSLNSRDFSDYQILVEQIRPLIDKYSADNQKQLVKDRDMESHAIRTDSIDYIKNIYNKKLSEFRTNFFWNDELIRGEIVKNPDVLEKIKLKSYLYLMGVTLTSLRQKFDGPTEINSSNVNNDHFNRNYESGYYLKPKPVSIQSKSEGCFIATFAYDSYEHSDVLILRKFRDNILLKTSYGKRFVEIYYNFSPKMVKFFSLIKFPKTLVKAFLRITIIGYLKRIRD